ncbi:Von willebrand factor type A (vWA) domain was originally protein (macronuclear) [Tetrahymena thermophila SB210]|uniref:von willebrand factor type A (VWA) domain was originally protein n=1 Tax=Tetrahymena thermophila (strain SB210) TaxID=312017 RepID=Q231J4_TETTS|nr:Von willebrand factor type A (vWA) domain was originally protein [Tetrahymena thermophila SB210]EAR91045.1 Von willebrand factor type A (vWA) domain was originally protein [Tetrahymena thermophila SB210]|eukprot:XP_001011290.1 Von willebrand factor type A (vWA) domain was originally protein [Tetrahymena thermophila SB210]
MGNTLQYIPYFNKKDNSFQDKSLAEQISGLHTDTGSDQTKADYFLKDNLSLSIKLLNNKIVMDKKNNQIIPGVVSVEAKDFDADQVKKDKVRYQPLDLIFVIDTSGSMQGKKIELVKKSILQVLHIIQGDDRISLVGFNSQAKVLLELTQLTKNSKKKIQKTVDELQAGGGTQIGFGMQKAFDIIKERTNSKNLASIFLLSDGQDNCGFSQTQHFMNQSKIEYPFCIDCFGFGDDHDSLTLSKINQLQQGTFNFIRDISQIDDAFTIILAGIKTFVAQNVKISVNFGNTELMNGITVSKTYGSEWKKIQDKQYEIQLNHLMAGRSKDFVFELQIPQFEMKLTDQQRYQIIGSAKIKANSLNQGKKKITKKANLMVELFLNTEVQKKDLEKEDDEKVAINHFRVIAGEAMGTVLAQADKNQFENSQSLLNEIINKIKNSKYKNNPTILNLLKDLHNCQQAAQSSNYSTFGRGYVMNAQQVTIGQQVACNFDYKYANRDYILAEQNMGQERFRSINRRYQNQ